MMCRVQIDGKVLDVKRTFAEKNIKPNSILFAAQVDSGAPLQKWTRLSAENLNYDNPSSFGSSHALDFIAKRNLNFFGFGMYTITKS